ncbi:hypothetical protein [Geminocystis sp. GBBB08]|uniref:hypothetical protein n=1 Tax=Geminocystis sp. GBBB08 TaxID=2604140 RepID=UPI0027E29BF6|nr:hypothetical protein [Geminocystis sp. GBBB08]MBL1208281.1 hypothetical protein [Geminocystis sp. GBBB08]
MKKEEKLINKPNDVIKTMITQFCGTIDRLVIMLGTKQIVYDNATAMIKFDFKTCRKATLCSIRYDYGMDTYEMEFYKFNRKAMEWETVKTFDNVYCEELTIIFEDFTGLILNYRPEFISY